MQKRKTAFWGLSLLSRDVTSKNYIYSAQTIRHVPDAPAGRPVFNIQLSK